MKTGIKNLIMAVLPTIYTTIAVLFILPDTVAAHFGVNGAPDRYGSKFEAYIPCGIILGVYVLYIIMRSFSAMKGTDDDSKKQKNLEIFDTVISLIFILLNFICLFALLIMTKPEIMQSSDSIFFAILSVAIGTVLIIMGNISPKIKRNNFIGMKLSFAMDTDEHWYTANRSGGIALLVSGFGTVAAGLVLRNLSFIFVMIVLLIVSITVAIIYSYVKIKKEKS